MKLTKLHLLWGLLLLALLIGGCGGDNESAVATADVLEPQAGGMALPAATPPATDVPSVPTPTATPLLLPSLEVGQQVVARDGRSLRLYTDAGEQMSAMEEYAAGQVLTVIEPSSRYPAGYPVQKDNIDWYRVRDQDGLVGWVRADQIEPAP